MTKYFTDITAVLKYFQDELDQIDKFIENTPSVRRDIYRLGFKKSPKFDPVQNRNGNIELVPSNQSIFLYRGQGTDWGNCDSVLKRLMDENENQDEGFVHILRALEFEIVLSKHPAVQELLKEGYNIDYMGLAQHYGFPTNYIDFTSDIDVAAFFACSEWNSLKNEYQPKNGGKGEIYKTRLVDYFCQDGTSEFFPLGLQPFPRPEVQKAYAMMPEKGIRGERCIFNHDYEASKEILTWFDGGKKLFPTDPLVQKANSIHNTKTISVSAVMLLTDRYRNQFIRNMLQSFLRHNEIECVPKSIHHFSNDELGKFQEEWIKRGRQNFFGKINSPVWVYKP